MNFINTKKANSTLQEEFFVRYKNYLVPIGVKAKNNHSKSLSTLIKSPNYKEIGFGDMCPVTNWIRGISSGYY